MKYSKIVPLFMSFVLTASLLTGCGEKAEVVEADTTIEVEVGNPELTTITVSSDFSGTVQAESQVLVIPKIAGEVVEKNYEIGDHVNEGDLLFAIDDTSAQIALKQAKAGVTQAQAGYTSQQASTASTIASAAETLGKMSTNEQQLANAVDSAYAQKIAAGNNLDTAGATEEYQDDKLEDLKDDLEDAKDKKDKLKKQLNESGGDETIAAAYETAKSTVESLEDAIDELELTHRSGANSAESAEMNYYVAQEGYDLAVKNQQDYQNYTKNTTLYGVNAQVVGADAALTNSGASLETAKANLENAQLALDYTKVKAPVAGVITNIGVSLHNMASQSTVAYTIEADAKSKVVFYVAEETVKNLKPGNDVHISKGTNSYEGRITNVADTIDSETGLFEIEASVNGSNDLVTGSTVSVRTVTREADKAVSVPINSVFYDEEQPYVFVNEGNVAKRVDIETGLSNESVVEVVSGLTTDDNVITSYSTKLKDGSEIKVISSAKESN
ncbi:MAG: efflux RND transporter periplasmic adaptor subunit [Lachnospiraceae bacterium]|nr:efflux RND transporter periplasmic adaptor subunit [Lachnospiraceae bacterium]